MTLTATRFIAGTLLAVSAAQPVFADRLGEHPAVEVARTWSSQPIDANTFIVAHPARLTLLSTPTAEPDYAERLGEHPAVEIARTWSSHSIDANTFIVAHPARLTLLSVTQATQEPILATRNLEQTSAVKSLDQ